MNPWRERCELGGRTIGGRGGGEVLGEGSVEGGGGGGATQPISRAALRNSVPRPICRLISTSHRSTSAHPISITVPFPPSSVGHDAYLLYTLPNRSSTSSTNRALSPLFSGTRRVPPIHPPQPFL